MFGRHRKNGRSLKRWKDKKCVGQIHRPSGFNQTVSCRQRQAKPLNASRAKDGAGIKGSSRKRKVRI